MSKPIFKKHSIFFRIFIGNLLIISTLSALILLFSLKTIRTHYINTLRDSLKKYAKILEPEVTPFVLSGSYEDLDRFVKRIGAETSVRITIIAPDGKVLADSRKDPAKMENHFYRPEIQQALKRGFGSSLRYSTTVHSNMLYVAIKKLHTPTYFVRVSMFVKDINTLLGNLRSELFVFVIFVTLLSILGAFIFTRNLSKPMSELVHAADLLSKGKFDIRVNIERDDEIGELANSFNIMAKNLDDLFNTIKLKQDELNTIIASLDEGLLVLNAEGKTILYNESLKKLLKVDPAGKYYWEFLSDHELMKFLENAINRRESGRTEFNLHGRTYLANLTVIHSKREFVIVFHDITELKNLERIKRDIVANVSHELRTPLTAIKGYVETLEELAPQDLENFVQILRRHTDRLINIVNDLLSLSRLESGGIHHTPEKFDLQKIARDVVSMYRPRAEEKGLSLCLKSEGDLLMEGYPLEIEQLIVNLVDNAIKYTEKGRVCVKAKGNRNTVTLIVEDTGIGIPEEHLPRIFERFYVVSKSRSRSLGGTGLGLSIVKHVTALHRGEISVDSIPGKGSRFIVTLPRFLTKS